jgi:hypothetical protein
MTGSFIISEAKSPFNPPPYFLVNTRVQLPFGPTQDLKLSNCFQLMSKNRAREHAPGLHKSVSTEWCSCKKLSELGNQILGLKCMMVVRDMERPVITHCT